ncbi:aldehyde dehydrogenase family protein [Nocardia donostiensis]|uniref:Aldehyde dehydrogenase n=1 Tax=Nocardia donostiensis TaxID=1538463 RepID=A0A1V2TGM0_9NOCA|nr:aldehyde dehydrogenase family protein [Nocardia donostiensis]ONM48613.1 aldehyde dehydrogenase [Nocardia donostiensis]OQS16802.1 aldehyde dehydrogenase [Nocardia donostiensis]OQS23267.1 aldehyde dehydrogenase [Nocardia donostiensis]
MAIVQPLAPTSDGRRRLELRNPATREPVGEIEVSTADDVAAAVARARAAQPAWAARPVSERAAIVRRAVSVLIARRDEIVATVQAETGKPRAEALAIELVPSCDFLNYWSGRAAKDLTDERRRLHGYLRPLKKLVINYQPLGVVGVITPWNGPFVLSLNPVAQALLAGNAVILKPSEVTPHAGEWAAKVLHEAGVPADVLQVVHGDGETGAALVNTDIDKISFTGSVPTGKKIAAACAERLIPCTLELGGKDAMIVCADADLERAARGAVYLSMFNSGQVCVGVERIYVVDSIADEFIEMVRTRAAEVTYGPGSNTDVGPLFWDRQLDVVSRHVEDAKAKGATIVLGGEPDTAQGAFFKPTMVVDVTHEMELMREETFGPIVAIMRVRDEEEAIRLANDCKYGLSGSVFTKDPDKAIRIGKRLHTGSVVHNDASVIYGVPEAPFGGRKDSGLGQVNGREALRGFTHPQPILLDRWQLKKENIWYPYEQATVKTLERTIGFVFGSALARRLMR